MSIKIKKIWIVIGIIFLALCLTNPSPRAFKDYLGFSQTKTTVERKYNWIVFSIYRVPDEYYKVGGKWYLGIFMNFFDITKTSN